MTTVFNSRLLTYFVLILFLIAVSNPAIGLDTYTSNDSWNFGNDSYLNFEKSIYFDPPPQHCAASDDSLTGYWKLDEGSENVVIDDSSNHNNGILVGNNSSVWTSAKYGYGLNFDGFTNYVKIPNSLSLTMNESVTVAVWIKQRADGIASSSFLVGKTYFNSYDYGLEVHSKHSYQDRKFAFMLRDNSTSYALFSTTQSVFNQWYFVVGTYDGHMQKIYVNGILENSANRSIQIKQSGQNFFMGSNSAGGGLFNGVIDSLQVYNRALDSAEISAIYTSSPQPDSAALSEYYNFQDTVSNNLMLIHVNKATENTNDTTLVTCLDFFNGNRLSFQTNSSAVVNIWTNLGQPTFTTGVWNSRNYTTTLWLATSSSAILDWNTYNIVTYTDPQSGIYPSNVSVPYWGKQTFNFNTSQGYTFDVIVDGESQGQINSYTFNNVTEGHIVKATSAPSRFTISSKGDSGSDISPSGDFLVDYGNSQLFTINNKTGYKITHVFIDGDDYGELANYTLKNITGNHTIAVVSELLSNYSPMPSTNPSSYAVPSATPNQSPKSPNLQSPSPTPIIQKNWLSVRTIIAVAIIPLIIVGLIVAVRKRYVNIEVVDEE